jgi:glycosyltransferase involved in cell wall biosynthesis
MGQIKWVHENRAWQNIKDKPLLSVVSPCYKVRGYVHKLLKSLNRQSEGLRDVEIIFVIDGCPDGSEEPILEWAKSTDLAVKVVFQENTGVSGVRNTGLEFVRGTWVTFPDPDDYYGKAVFSQIRRANREYPDADMMVMKLNKILEDGNLTPHPLDYRFAYQQERRIVHLEREPEMIVLHAATVAFRVSELQRTNLKFDRRMRVFEDAKFITQYLLALDVPSYVMLPHANYMYVQRQDESSALGAARKNYGRYVETSAWGYLGIAAHFGSETLPRWVANLLLYDFSWLFKDLLKMVSPVHSLSRDQQLAISKNIKQALQKIDAAHVKAFNIVEIPEQTRAAWLYQAKHGSVAQPWAVLKQKQPRTGMRRIVYFSSHDSDHLEVELYPSGKDAQLADRKIRAVRFLGSTWAYEHALWFFEGTGFSFPRVRNVNEPKRLEFNGAAFGEAAIMARRTPPKCDPQLLEEQTEDLKSHTWFESGDFTSVLNKFRRFALRISGYPKRFKDAWVVCDRDTQANDNGEVFYEYLQREHPRVNAWFTLRKTSPHYRALKKRGFRVVPYGSMRHFWLMKNAIHLISSQVDHYIMKPFPRWALPRTWLFTFLQHGVIKDNMSRWLNSKDIDLFITSTRGEFESIAGNYSEYRQSKFDVALTEMPRTDRLLERVRKLSKDNAKTLLIMPTWRNFLVTEPDAATTGNSRSYVENLYETVFMRSWLSFLNGEVLREIHFGLGYRVVLLPHPNVENALRGLEIPDYLERRSYINDRVEDVIASSTLAVTDFSSQAFEAAYVGAPTVYFQFDREEVFGGNHVATQGYFDYFDNGFGPVAEDLQSFESELLKMAAGDHPRYEEYMERIQSLFPYQDGHACYRVYQAILDTEKGNAVTPNL